MKTPKRTEYLVNYLSKNILSSKSTIAPTLLRGPEGCGKSWITSGLFALLEKEPAVIPVWVPYRLSGKNLVPSIVKAVEKKEQQLLSEGISISDVKKRKVVLFVERIDQLFNLTGKEECLVLLAFLFVESELYLYKQHALMAARALYFKRSF